MHNLANGRGRFRERGDGFVNGGMFLGPCRFRLRGVDARTFSQTGDGMIRSLSQTGNGAFLGWVMVAGWMDDVCMGGGRVEWWEEGESGGWEQGGGGVGKGEGESKAFPKRERNNTSISM